jgi:hypothetical protein
VYNLASQQTVLMLSDEDNRRIETGKGAILRPFVAAASGLLAAYLGASGSGCNLFA